MTEPDDESNAPLGEEDFNTSELLSRAQGGDRQAVERIFQRVLPLLFRHAHGRLPAAARGRMDTADVVQDTLAAIIPKLGQFDPAHPERFKAYLKKAARNRVIDEARRVKRQGVAVPAESIQLPSNEMTPAEAVLLREDYERFLRAFRRLPPRERELIAGRLHLGLSYRELAAATGRSSEDAARVALRRALGRLAEWISGGGEGDEDEKPPRTPPHRT